MNAGDCWRHSGRGKQVTVRQPTDEQEPEATDTFRRRKRAWGHPWKPAPGGPSRDGRSCQKGNSLRSHPCPTGRPRKGQERLLGPRNDPRMFHGGNRLQSKSQLRTLLKQVSRLPHCWACQGFNILPDTGSLREECNAKCFHVPPLQSIWETCPMKCY